MARPHKTGLDYFPLDVDMETDSTVAYIEAKHGSADGFAVLVKLLMRVYRDEGYFARWNEREAFVFARQTGIDHETVSAIVADAIAEGMFDARLYATYGVLTSKGIQTRYIVGTARRGRVEFENALLLANRAAREAKHIVLVTDRFTVTANPAEGLFASTETTETTREERGGDDTKKAAVSEAVAHLNLKTGKAYRASTAATARHITARLNDGYTLDDLKAVIDLKVAEWKGDSKMEKYLRPETLFGSKFEGYLNERKGNSGHGTATEFGSSCRDGDELLRDGDGGEG